MVYSTSQKPVELSKITIATDTREYLSHAKRQADSLKDYFIVDVDGHVFEPAFWSDITNRIDNDVMRHMAKSLEAYGGGRVGLLNAQPGMHFHDMAGRIPHEQAQAESTEGEASSRAVVLTRRAMDSMGVDRMVVFPTPMLLLGMHPQVEVEVQLGRAFNSWLIEEIIPQERRILGIAFLPFNDPEACVKIVEEYGDKVIGFMVASTRYKAVHDNAYMKLYSMLEELGKPLLFHAGYTWEDPSMKTINRFIGVHSLSFVHFSLVHITNWVLNGLSERFPKLKVVWVESGLAWVPFIMQRLDNEYLMRPSEAPLLKRMPSEYIADMFFTSQPLERHNLKLTESTFDAIRAETQLLYSSDWPHWDFDPPSTISSLPFLNEQGKRNILGLNAARLFGLEVPEGKDGKGGNSPDNGRG